MSHFFILGNTCGVSVYRKWGKAIKHSQPLIKKERKQQLTVLMWKSANTDQSHALTQSQCNKKVTKVKRKVSVIRIEIGHTVGRVN